MSKVGEEITAHFPEINTHRIDEKRVEVNTDKGYLLSLLNFLKDGGYDHLGLISCVDRMEDGVLQLVYVLSRYAQDESVPGPDPTLVVKIPLSREEPTIVSSMGVFINAEPYERELYEMFGIDFTGHPRLDPLFLERDYDIPPLRKDFDTRRYVTEEFETIPPVED
ncbi:NADH-quinone oxidoreductase subunit C [Candidatus Bipolaricaulota bacterium]|nr:NADH-quinone oxidoreductase subunit C [Candidatus Bipolaricaulota bacterium]